MGNALALLVLAISGFHHWQIGMTPLARDFRWPQITAHHRLAQEFIALIPPEASLSAQSNLYPHVAHRERAYLFPAVNDAEYIFLDVTSPSYPLDVGGLAAEIQWTLEAGGFGVVKAQDGYLLLQRGRRNTWDEASWRDFLTFTRAGDSPASHPLRVRFGDELELVGYDYAIHNVVAAGPLPVTVTACWRPLRPQHREYGFAFFFTRADGAIVGQYDGPTATTAWYPTAAWQEDETLCMTTPILPIGRLADVLVAVTLPQADAGTVEGRLRPVQVVEGQGREVLQEGSLLKLFEMRSP